MFGIRVLEQKKECNNIIKKIFRIGINIPIIFFLVTAVTALSSSHQLKRSPNIWQKQRHLLDLCRQLCVTRGCKLRATPIQSLSTPDGWGSQYL